MARSLTEDLLATDLLAARQQLDELQRRWPVPEPAVVDAARRVLTDTAHRQRLRDEDHGSDVDAALRRSCADLLHRISPPAGGGVSFTDYLLKRLAVDDQHPFLVRAARSAPQDVAPIFAQQMAADLDGWQAIARLVDVCLGTGQMPAQRDPGAATASRNPLAVGTPPWEPTEARRALGAAFRRARQWGEMVELLGDLVHQYGLGSEQGCAAYRFVGSNSGPELHPVSDFAAFDLSWLSGNETRIARLESNTLDLLDGFHAQNALIWGPRGCGKSSMIRGLICRYWSRGLRGIEVPTTSYAHLHGLFDLVRDRPEFFIAILDNIAVDRHDELSRVLSTVLDGGVEAGPANLVFYATSNFKDLVDREGERPDGPPPLQADSAPPDRRTTEAAQERPTAYDPQAFQRLDERRGLDDRFALKVFVDMPTKTQYEQLVLDYARRAGVEEDEAALLADFQVWRMRNNHDLVGGRTARDYILTRYPDCARTRGDGARAC